MFPFVAGPLARPAFAGIFAAVPPPWLGPVSGGTKPDDGTGTLTAPLIERAKDPLPFATLPRRSYAAPAPAASPVPYRAPPIAAVDAAAMSPIVPARTPEPMDALPAAPAQRPPEAPAAPAWIGPLVMPERIARAEADKDKALAEPKKPAPRLAPVPAPTPVLPLDAFPIERCAAIAASLARRKADAASILEQNDLNKETWQKLDNHWAEAIREETQRGRTRLLKIYDAAYVGRLEEERGLLRVEEYARLVVAVERGNAEHVLAQMTLPLGALTRIARVWLDKIVNGASLARAVDQAIEAAREI